MKKLLISTSVVLLSLSHNAVAEEIHKNFQPQNNLCSSIKEMELSNYSKNLLIAGEIIIDSRPSYDSKCGNYYTTCKSNGKCYECIKCSYGGPYCWEISN